MQDTLKIKVYWEWWKSVVAMQDTLKNTVYWEWWQRGAWKTDLPSAHLGCVAENCSRRITRCVECGRANHTLWHWEDDIDILPMPLAL